MHSNQLYDESSVLTCAIFEVYSMRLIEDRIRGERRIALFGARRAQLYQLLMAIIAMIKRQEPPSKKGAPLPAGRAYRVFR